MATNLKKKLQEEGRLKEARNLINKQARDYGNNTSYGRGNINLNNRPVVQNDDGSISTVRSMSFYDENEGKEILIPTVVNGKIVSDDEAINHYYNTGEYLGKFNSIKEANSYADYLHKSQENMYSKVSQRASQLMAITEFDKSKMLDTNEFLYNMNKEKIKKENEESLKGVNDGTLGGYVNTGILSALNTLKSIVQRPKNFYDGYQLGDITKTAGSTALGVGTHIIGGIEGIGNSITQGVGYGLSAVNDIAGNKETAERWKRATQEQQKEHEEVKNKIYDIFDKNSLLGETSNQVAEGVGQSTALGVVGSKSKLAGNLLTFQQGFGTSLHDTYSKKDAEGWQALLRGVGSGAISTLTENIFELQGFGGSGIDDAIKNKVTRQIESGIGKALARTAISAGGEGTEEILESLGNTGLNYIMNRITEQVGHGAKFDENINIEEIVESAMIGFLNGGLGEGGSIYAQNNASSNALINQIEQDTNSKLTNEEKKAIRQETLLNSETQRENDIIIDNSNLTDSQKEHLKEFASQNHLNTKQVEQAIEMAIRHNEQLTSQEYDFNNNIEVDVDNLNETNIKEDTLKSQIHSILEGETTITDLINNNENITDEQKQELIDLTKDENNNLIDVLNQMNDYENVSNKVDINQNLDYNINQGNRDTSVQNITVAPYYNTPITSENFNEVKGQVETDFKNKAETITNLFGGKVTGIQTNIGGYTFQEGETAGQMVNELSYTFELQDVDETQANLIASLMGDLGYEQQESVISSNYLDADSTEANSVETVINFNDINGVKEALEKVGITDYTIDTNNNQVKIYSDSLTDDVIASAKALSQELGGNYNGAEWNKTNSRFLDKETRGRIYQEWLENNSREQEGELYKNVTQAYEKLQREVEDNNIKINIENKISNKEINIVSSAINTDTPNLENGINFKEYGDYFYIFNKNDFDDYFFEGKIQIEGNQEYISSIRKVIKNGEFDGESDVISQIVQATKNDRRFDNRNNVNVENGQTSFRNDELYNGQQGQAEQGYDNKKSNGNSKQINENPQNEGSFSMQQDEEVFREETDKLLNNELPKTKPRQFPLSVQESDYVSDDVKKENSRKILKTETGQYTPIGNQETIDKANEKIQNSGADNVYTSFNTKFENNEKITLNDIAEAELLIQHYSEIGDTEKAVKLIENVGILGTELGQQVQALSIIKKMTPQGQLAVANKLAERLSKKYDTDIKISKETQDLIKNSKMENIDDAMDKAYTEIADQLPLTVWERLDNFRFLMMLGNPKTHIRNMVGNTGNRVLTNVKNTVKGGIEDVIGMAWKDYQKNATIGIANKDQRTFAKLDAELLGEAIDDVGNKYNDNPNTEISKRKRHFDNKILNAMSKFNTEMLNKEDVWALKGAYRDALQNYMLANNLSSEDLTVLETDSREVAKQKEEALRKAREYASNQAKEATFHQANEVATWLNNLKNSESLPRKSYG